MFIWTCTWLARFIVAKYIYKQYTHTHAHLILLGRVISNWIELKWYQMKLLTRNKPNPKNDRCIDKSVSFLLLIWRSKMQKRNLIRITAFSCCNPLATFLPHILQISILSVPHVPNICVCVFTFAISVLSDALYNQTCSRNGFMFIHGIYKSR